MCANISIDETLGLELLKQMAFDLGIVLPEYEQEQKTNDIWYT